MQEQAAQRATEAQAAQQAAAQEAAQQAAAEAAVAQAPTSLGEVAARAGRVDSPRLQFSRPAGSGVKPLPFNDFIEEAIKGKTPANAVLTIAPEPSPVLQSAGLPAIPMEMKRSVLRRKTGKHGEMNLDILRQLPTAINNPMAVYVSPGDRKAHAIVTTLNTPAGPVTLYSTVRTERGRQTLQTKTVFGKAAAELLQEMREARDKGLIRHLNNAAFDTWLTQRDGVTNDTSAQHLQAIEGLSEFFAQFDSSVKPSNIQASRAGERTRPLNTLFKNTREIAQQAARLLDRQMPGIVGKRLRFFANPAVF